MPCCVIALLSASPRRGLPAKRQGQEIAENNDLSPDFCEPAQSQELRLHNREKPLDEKNADTVSRGDSESASDPMTFADNGERNKLRGLDNTDGRNKKRERRIWTKPFNPYPRGSAKIL